MKEAVFHFPVKGKPISCQQIKSGHINETYLISTDGGEKYILQWINRYVFPNVDALMNNMSAISAFLRRAQGEKTAMISYIDTLEGESYYDDGDGGCWRIYRFVDNSICLQRPESLDDFYECARAFGAFQYALRDFPVDSLVETIERFHDTPDRFRLFQQAMEQDCCGRLKSVAAEVSFALERQAKACVLHSMRNSGQLPVRVTHNDTKINNVLLDEKTRKAICVIDLDTVMPGLSVHDFGDAIRFGASTAAEDEQCLDKVALDLDMYRIFTRGFTRACPSLSETELEMLPLGAYTMTLECGLRFLTDYLNGDKYFSIDRQSHNLDRCRSQFKLVQDMEQKWQDMERITRQETGR